MASPSTTGCLEDASLGPFVAACRGGFDFTLRFEQIFLSTLPAALFVLLALARILWLSKHSRILHGYALQYCKLTLVIALVALQAAILNVQAVNDGASSPDHWAVAAAATQLAAAICLLPLSSLEHARAARPSTLITCFLLVQILLDAAQVRTAWMVSRSSRTIAHLLTATVSVKAIILVAEAQRKTRWLRWNINEHSPEETSGIVSLSVFLWLNRLFLRGYQSILAVEDLYPLDPSMHSAVLQGSLDRAFSKHPRGAKFGLSRALVRAFLLPLLAPVITRVALIGFAFSQPFFGQALLRYLQQPQASANLGYGLIGASILIFGGMALARALYSYFHDRFLCMVRGSLSAAIYSKTSTAKLAASGTDAAAVTLMSTDTERVVKGLDGLHEFWANMIEIAIGSWLLYRQIGSSFVAPFILLLISMVLMGCIGRLIGRRQSIWMQHIQKRVGATSNVIANMKNLKLGGMAGPVSQLIEGMRMAELRVGNGFRWLFIVTVMASIMPTALSPLFTLVFASSELDTTTMFTSLSFIMLLTTPLIQGIRAVPKVIAAFTCLGRIQAFLEDEAHADFRIHGSGHGTTSEKRSTLLEKVTEASDTACPKVVLENGSFGWREEQMALKNLTISFPASKLSLIVGPTASGKSTLCKALLGETPFASGTLNVTVPRSAIGFCDSNPFLYNATIKENIIGHSEFIQTRYDEVIEACMLRPDLQGLPHGDGTNVGSNGMGLSGGQKKRVSLARALYLGSALVILDDVVSALDNNTANEIMQRLFGPDGLLRRRNATVILCTHSVRALAFSDHIVVLGPDGTVADQGTLEALQGRPGYVASLNNNRISSPSLYTESEDQGPTHGEGHEGPLRNQGSLSQDTAAALDERSRLTGDLKVYRHYLRSLSVSALAASTLFALSFALAGGFGTVWLKYWAEKAFDRPKAFYAGIFGLAQGTQLLMALGTCISVAIVATTQSGSILHDEAFHAVVQAPLRLLTTSDLGAVTTLFSQDMTLIDGELPLALLNILINIFDSLVKLAVVAVASPWLALSYPFIAGLLWVVQKFYLRTSRQMRLLDLETKGPLITHFLDTMRGLATIRAFGWTEHNLQRNHSLLTDSQRPAYLLSMIQNWLSLALDLIVATIALIVVSLATQTRSNAGFTGASLVMLMTLAPVVTRLIRFYTDLETSIGAVARIKSFSESAQPEILEGEDVVPAVSWPHAGMIKINGVSAAYNPEDQGAECLALKDIMLLIQSGQKIAVCGRSGSGKSSLVLLLMRLLDPLPACWDHIEIDGLPLHRIDREALRQRILAVPQDAVFLPDASTIKDNIDIANTSTDSECEDVLRAVGLDQLIAHGIHSCLNPDNLSAGQKQLLSLGRAMVRHRVKERQGGLGGILLLDELSSSVDQETERLMQDIIRHEFGRYTVVAISHRLDFVADYYDVVVVMDEGRIVEQGDPKLLRDEDGSHFSRLLRLGSERRS